MFLRLRATDWLGKSESIERRINTLWFGLFVGFVNTYQLEKKETAATVAIKHTVMDAWTEEGLLGSVLARLTVPVSVSNGRGAEEKE